jgi:hypothetical protein
MSEKTFDELIADDLKAIAAAVDKLRNSKLKDSAIELLLIESIGALYIGTGTGRRKSLQPYQLRQILDGISKAPKLWLKEEKSEAQASLKPEGAE